MNKFLIRPDAVARIRGGIDTPSIFGDVKFYQKRGGVLVVAEIFNLPMSNNSGFFAFHIHEGNSCSGEKFSNTGSHFNPTSLPHPNHAGDLPPLMLCGGGAYMAVMSDRFRIEDVIGRTVVIHSGADDFTSQPSGNAGDKIACGVIARK